jgi:hypothetical protein
MPDAPLDWKIACLKTIRDMPPGAGFMEGTTSKQDLIWIQDLERDGYISAMFRKGYVGESTTYADFTIPNMIWDVHILDKGRRLIAFEEQPKSLTQKSKQDSGNYAPAYQGSGTNCPPNIPSGLFSPDALEAAGGLVFLVVGGAFHYAGGWFHCAGFTFDFLAVCCGLTIVTHHADEKTFKLFGFRYWLSLLVCLFLFVLLAVHVAVKENSRQPNQHPIPLNPTQ